MPQGKFAQATCMLLAPNCSRSLLMAGVRSCSSNGSASALKSSTPADTVSILGITALQAEPSSAHKSLSHNPVNTRWEKTAATRIWDLGWMPHLGAVSDSEQRLNKQTDTDYICSKQSLVRTWHFI